MTSIEPPAASPTPTVRPPRLSPLKRSIIWALFLLLIYVTRDFFFLAFMTFMFSYMALAVIDRIMKRLSPNHDRPGVRRLVTIGVFILAPMILLVIGAIVAPSLIAQGQKLAGWLNHVSPEAEIARQLEQYVGPSEFRLMYGGPDDPRYQAGLEEFKKTVARHVAAYLQFPTLEAWIEGGFSKQFGEAETTRIRSRLMSEGTSSKDFEHWFLTEKFPELQARAKKDMAEKGRTPASSDPLVRLAATARPEDLLQQVRRDPVALTLLREEWINHAIGQALAAAKNSPAYQQQFREYYEKQRVQSPDSTPYTYQQFDELQKARSQGPRAFGETLDKVSPSPKTDGGAQLSADFEAARKHELFQNWWSTNSTAKFIQHEVNSLMSSDNSGFVERALASFLNVPLDLMTALLLSFFICIDFPRMKRAAQRLRDSGLRDVYDEIAPALSSLALLVGKSMQAQGLIAACNATIIFLALTILSVEHAMLLSVAVFVLCLVPTLGMIIAWVLLVAVALVQPGGGLALALKVTAAVVVVVILETFVFSPRILGRLMELHPVLIIAILPIAHYFFGVWGLILAVPVTVFLIHDVIFGMENSNGSPANESS